MATYSSSSDDDHVDRTDSSNSYQNMQTSTHYGNSCSTVPAFTFWGEIGSGIENIPTAAKTVEHGADPVKTFTILGEMGSAIETMPTTSKTVLEYDAHQRYLFNQSYLTRPATQQVQNMTYNQCSDLGTSLQFSVTTAGGASTACFIDQASNQGGNSSTFRSNYSIENILGLSENSHASSANLSNRDTNTSDQHVLGVKNCLSHCNHGTQPSDLCKKDNVSRKETVLRPVATRLTSQTFYNPFSNVFTPHTTLNRSINSAFNAVPVKETFPNPAPSALFMCNELDNIETDVVNKNLQYSYESKSVGKKRKQKLKHCLPGNESETYACHAEKTMKKSSGDKPSNSGQTKFNVNNNHTPLDFNPLAVLKNKFYIYKQGTMDRYLLDVIADYDNLNLVRPYPVKEPKSSTMYVERKTALVKMILQSMKATLPQDTIDKMVRTRSFNSHLYSADQTNSQRSPRPSSYPKLTRQLVRAVFDAVCSFSVRSAVLRHMRLCNIQRMKESKALDISQNIDPFKENGENKDLTDETENSLPGLDPPSLLISKALESINCQLEDYFIEKRTSETFYLKMNPNTSLVILNDIEIDENVLQLSTKPPKE